MDDMPDSDESAAKSALSSHPNQTISEVVYFDDEGDVRVVVHDEGVQKVFITSSKAMSLFCDPWERMFAGNFKEAQAGEDGTKEVSLPEDDPKALTILLNIAHLRFDKLPKQSLWFEGLRDLIVLSNKYCTTILLKPWIDVWSDYLRERSAELGYEYGREELLFVYWELGEELKLQNLTIRLAKEVEISANGKCVNKKGKVLDPDEGFCYFPPGLLGKRANLVSCLFMDIEANFSDSILCTRTQTIDLMLDSLYYYVDQ